MRCFNSMTAALCFGPIDTAWLVSDGKPASDAPPAAAFPKGGSS
ncbi:hypothetical protein [Burkholderia sp. WSM2232]|nr:hypothetical protein [Burkholderia sp. WSM2232]